MIENTDFEAMLDADPTDQTTRLIYSDWLLEHGDTVYANGLRWIAENERNPRRLDHWYWYWLGGNWKDFPQGVPSSFWREVGGTYRMHNGIYPTRQAAERDLANALAESLAK